MKKAKILKSVLKDIFYNEIALKTYLLLCFILLGFAIYNILDLIFIF